MTSRPGSGKSRDKGTRGGRPDPQPIGTPSRGNGQRQRSGPRSNGQAPQAARRPATAVAPRQAAAAPAVPGTRPVPFWFQITTWVLAAIGLGFSIYLTIAHYTSTSILACSDKGFINCAAVTTSPESMVFGIFPVAVLGLAFYVFMFAITSPWAWRVNLPAVRWVRLAGVIVGMVFVLYLIYTELITLREICLLCTSVHVITFLLFGLLVFGAAAGYGTPATSRGR
jgi:uncharacterized membrane protein